MIFKLSRADDPWDKEPEEIEVHDLTQLMLLQEKEGDLIIRRDDEGNPLIEI